MEETKRCPYCGEEILAVAKKCKHCGEWLEEKRSKACPVCGEQIDEDASICPHCKEKLETTNENIVNKNSYYDDMTENYLYCKSCKRKISDGASSCPHCGDSDPFYFNELKKNKKNSNIGCFGVFGIAFIIIIITRFCGMKEGLLNPNKTQFVIFVIVFVFLYIVLKLGFKLIKDEKTKIIQGIYDSQTFEKWKKSLDEYLEN